jgi:hypothetical protein
MTEQDEHIKRLMRQALDEALQQQIIHLFKIWLSNPADLAEQRKRTAIGAHNAIEVYRVAMSAVDSWEATQRRGAASPWLMQ